MKQLNTYDTKEEGEAALAKINEPKRLASERDSTEVIYNLFGEATWGNFYKLDMFNLVELKGLLEKRNSNQSFDQARYNELLSMLRYAAKTFDLQIPQHWL
ncbi:hypothetical protein PTE01_35620 [Pseudoalteromonas tetraodonis GFC]|jgi:hypothetical protein|uniref:Uncharacterized protein n=1 Tax=Pseudoalteromonas tetraodonis GFC TaxID=1315271 RepID=A0AA37S5P9_9GAMM|nr:hypothetical protein [Pseudoalteromonas tetraodonis]ATD02357.1 hypothetical protein PTET_a0842 [Pseudoalteromonas tetraodonis]GEN40452.1 hypothetical protein PTE01_35620 [Pseudoalteromonas tetraodonis GFC]GLQ03941.1 hypothetical protein GCM10007914_28220 [Pseudoalteromonas tetraodonis GFC]